MKHPWIYGDVGDAGEYKPERPVATQHRFASPEEIYQAGAVLLGVGELPW